jgi:hypothetical protein
MDTRLGHDGEMKTGNAQEQTYVISSTIETLHNRLYQARSSNVSAAATNQSCQHAYLDTRVNRETFLAL